MKTLLRLLGVTLYLLATFPSMADEARLQHLITQAEAAIARDDDEERTRIVDRIFKLTTGLDVKLESFPESLSAENYEKKLCIFHKAIAPLHTRDSLDLLHHESRFRAYVRFFIKRKSGIKIRGKTVIEAMQIRMECAQDNGDLVPEARALREGLAWAKRIEASDIAEVQTVAREYEVLLKDHPDDELYQWFSLMMGSLVERKRIHRDRKESEQRLAIITFRRELAEKADNGDVTAQLEVARRLETGDRFEKSYHFAYFWYLRAQQNNGGEEAQNGLDRLLPQLGEIDLMRVENWLEKKYLMY